MSFQRKRALKPDERNWRAILYRLADALEKDSRYFQMTQQEQKLCLWAVQFALDEYRTDDE